MNAEIEFLRDLKREGYFTQTRFDPLPVFQAAQKYFGIDVTKKEDDERLTTIINALAQEGIVRCEYSSDPTLHPRDILDHWRLVLTSDGAAMLENISR